MSSRAPFFKMSGSGNDFVFFDGTLGGMDQLETSEAVRAICVQETGIGADGVVFLRPAGEHAIRMRYYNSDGSLGELCGNATLCATRLAHELGMVSSAEMSVETDAGLVAARMVDGRPEIDFASVTETKAEV
ncbi:MAG: proline racemase family protein, partial [Gemmatimonadaceae bacterium]|nr:proline racemase family protein [Gemmatimonadaceae bacterium]